MFHVYNNVLFLYFLFRAMNYGVIGFLIAKDILHLILPDSKRAKISAPSYEHRI